MAVEQLTSTTPKVKLTSTETSGTGNMEIAILSAPGATTTYGSHTLVSGTAFQPNTSKPVYAQCYVTHTGKVTWQILSSGTSVEETILTAATVIVHQSLSALVPTGCKVKITLATSATVSALKYNTF